MISRTKAKRKILSLLLTAVMILALPPLTSSAEQLGAFEISGDTGYTYDAGALTIVNAGTFTVSMSGGATSTDKIVVNVPNSSESYPVDITIDDVVINLSNSSGACAFDIQGTSFVNLHISGSNILTSGAGRAGLQVSMGSTVNISVAGSDDSASLTADGGGKSAGIGGSGGSNGSNGAYHANAGSGTNGSAGGACGNVAISSGHVIAIGGDGGAGIGGGGGGSGGRGGDGAYAGHGGIGSNGGSCGNITISGGFVTASSSNGGAGIGGGAGGSGGRGGDGAYAGNGKNGGNAGSCGNVTISGGTITASTNSGGLGIGGGKAGAAGAGGSGAYRGSGGSAGTSGTIASCVISGGSVNATVGRTPTDGQESPSNVYLAVIKLTDSSGSGLEQLNMQKGGSPAPYGIQDIKTDAGGKLYLYLPAETQIASAFTTDGANIPTRTKYTGTITTASSNNINSTMNRGFTITGTPSGYDYGTDTLTITQSGVYLLSMGDSAPMTTNRIAVLDGVEADITLEKVRIDVSGTSGACAFGIQGSAIVNLTLRKDNTLISGNGCAGLQVPSGATLNITDTVDGTLTATGGGRGAGIGGAGGANGGNGAYHANAGSGTNGSAGGACGNVAISGGHVIAIGGDGGAGIGGGGGGAGGRGGDGAYAGHGGIGSDGGSCGNVTISGGFVTASSSNGGAGIGGGAGGSGGRGGDGAYGGNGKNGGNGGSCGNVTISGGTISSSSSAGGFGIGGGKAGTAGAGGSGAYSGSGGSAGTSGSIASCVISGGSVNATVGRTATDGQESPANVYLTVITLPNAIETAVSRLAVSPHNYGINDMKTDADGKLYLYLPSGSEITTIGTLSGDVIPSFKKYTGSVTTIDDHTGNSTMNQTGFTVTGSPSGYDYETDHLDITQTGEYLLSMSNSAPSTTNKIRVLNGAETDITLENVRIDVSGMPGTAFYIQGSAVVNLALSGYNTLISGANSAGLEVPDSSTLNITGTYTDRLTATGGDMGAGIGGGRYASGGIITINGGIITATGGSGAAGIGGGGAEENGNGGGTGGTVTLTGGIIFAQGNEASDIGPGRDRVGGVEYDSLNISSSSAVFLKNDSSTVPTSISHQHYDITGHTTSSSIYGIPVAWTGDFGAYLRVHTLSYDLAGGTVIPENPAEYAAGSNIILNNPIKPGYIFSGWSGTGITGTAVSVTIAAGSTDNRSYTANWRTSSSSTTHNAFVPVNGSSTGTLPVAVNAGTGSASIDVSNQTSLLSGGNSITVPPISGIDSYTLGILAPTLSTPANQGSLTVNTDLGNITIPSNMLTGFSGVSGSKVEITISQGDKGNLREDVKDAIGDKPLIQLTLSVDGKQTNWSNPGAPVEVSIPYTPTAEELANPERIVIWYIDGAGKVVTIPSGYYDPKSGTVTFNITHFSDYAVAYNKVSFSDVAAEAWYNKAVNFIAAREITTGTGNGMYSPAAKLTRGSFLVLIMKAYDISPHTNPTDNFSDAGNTYYTGFLAEAKRLGITSGIGDNMYAPKKEISRQEMFTLLYNTLEVMGQLPQSDSGKSLQDFTDAGQIDPWAKEAMTLLVETGTVGGSSGKLAPTGFTTRAEMAQVLYNLLGK